MHQIRRYREEGERYRGCVLGVPIDVVSEDQAVERICQWASERESSYVAICNVHVTVSACRDPEFLAVIEGANLAAPDGAPIAWMLRRLGYKNQRRVAGPDLMPRLLSRCEQEGISVYFYGSTDSVLSKLIDSVRQRHPNISVAGFEAPPFRPLTVAEDQEAISRINNSGAGIVFVGLGCPKQERWMAQHEGRVHGVMVGVGAAFDFYAGTQQRAPSWMQSIGLEWLHRLLTEPGRLWRRYLATNTLFVWGAFLQLIGLKYKRRL